MKKLSWFILGLFIPVILGCFGWGLWYHQLDGLLGLIAGIFCYCIIGIIENK